ncbi:MAG: SH3 domain-containing protein [Anaerolineaceae bacterium]|nr:MAG: SH3 domain-containing protein [Anaerolineaceae bacterium]
MRKLLPNSIKPLRPSCIWTIIGGAFGTALVIAILIIGVLSRRTSFANPPVEPKLTVVSRPTPTPQVEITPTRFIGTELPPSPTPPELPERDFDHGQLVTVFGTGGDGLRLRREPDLDAAIGFLGMENEVFRVIDGPIEADGYLWWYLVNPYEGSKSGWAVANYLRSADEP